MQFSELVTYVRDLVDDPSTAPAPTFADAKIKRFLNIKYLALRERARLVGESSARKITYLTPTSGDPLVAKPADYVNALSVSLELNGGDLSSLSPDEASVRILKPFDFVPAYQAWESGRITDPLYYSVKESDLVITAPPVTVGTSCIRLLYTASTAEMSDDADEPVIPRPYHDVIGLEAAVDLLATKGQENLVLLRRMQQRRGEFEEAVTDELWDPEYSAPTAGLDDQDTFQGRSGWIE